MQFLLSWNFSFCITEVLSQSCYLSVSYQTDFCLVSCCIIHVLNVQAGKHSLQKEPGLGHSTGLLLPMSFTEVPLWCSCHLTSPLAGAHWGIIVLFWLEDGHGLSWTVMDRGSWEEGAAKLPHEWPSATSVTSATPPRGPVQRAGCPQHPLLVAPGQWGSGCYELCVCSGAKRPWRQLLGTCFSLEIASRVCADRNLHEDECLGTSKDTHSLAAEVGVSRVIKSNQATGVPFCSCCCKK